MALVRFCFRPSDGHSRPRIPPASARSRGPARPRRLRATGGELVRAGAHLRAGAGTAKVVASRRERPCARAGGTARPEVDRSLALAVEARGGRCRSKPSKISVQNSDSEIIGDGPTRRAAPAAPGPPSCLQPIRNNQFSCLLWKSRRKRHRRGRRGGALTLTAQLRGCEALREGAPAAGPPPPSPRPRTPMRSVGRHVARRLRICLRFCTNRETRGPTSVLIESAYSYKYPYHFTYQHCPERGSCAQTSPIDCGASAAVGRRFTLFVRSEIKLKLAQCG
ncbi:hypothetical protein EVAR_63700_1 [Eumeta japonica]|uniref:Uncharacterized protein n=1 Tax=Eumeta variegata TaxID=151549 RepID=A0A4C1ZSX2_EUMVA|nr:hypothetical protein EVAR_63700_1 [Eumeta japonica]